MATDYFQLFGLEPDFNIDSNELRQRYRHLQRSVHPDRFAQAPQREQRLAVQQAALINDGFDTLKDPVKRAQYLLRRHGLDPEQQSGGAMDGEFLMQQMALREQLEAVRVAAGPLSELEALRQQVEAHSEQLQDQLAACFASGDESALQQAVGLTQKLQFFAKLLDEIEQLEHELDEF